MLDATCLSDKLPVLRHGHRFNPSTNLKFSRSDALFIILSSCFSGFTEFDDSSYLVFHLQIVLGIANIRRCAYRTVNYFQIGKA